jgi:hypothetical protein
VSAWIIDGINGIKWGLKEGINGIKGIKGIP